MSSICHPLRKGFVARERRTRSRFAPVLILAGLWAIGVLVVFLGLPFLLYGLFKR